MSPLCRYIENFEPCIFLEGHSGPHSFELGPPEDEPDMYDDVMKYLLDEWRTEFESGAADYGDAYEELGLKGQYSDLHRKMAKVKKALWEGQVLKREAPDEVLLDIIGHAFIAIWLLRNTEEGAKIMGRDGV